MSRTTHSPFAVPPHELAIRRGTRRDGIITYDGGRFYPADNTNYTMDPVRLFVQEMQVEESRGSNRSNSVVNITTTRDDDEIYTQRDERRPDTKQQKRAGKNSTSNAWTAVDNNSHAAVDKHRNRNNNSSHAVMRYDDGMTEDDDQSTVSSVLSDPSIQREINRNLYSEALRTKRSLSFIYNGGSQPGVERTVRPTNGGEVNGEKFKAYDVSNVLKTYYYNKVAAMKLV